MKAEYYSNMLDEDTALQTCTAYDFGCTDSKGRKLGAVIRTGVRTFVAAPAGQGGWTVAPGTHHYFRPQATRGGKKYGALQSTRYYPTAEQLEAAVQLYLANARKRASTK